MEFETSDLVLEARGLAKSYEGPGGRLPVLVDVDLAVPRGMVLAIVGASGSGKSTLLNIIAGIDHADAGSVRVAGVEITALSDADLARWRAAHVGFIFQFYNLIPVLSALENVELPLHLQPLTGRQRRAHAEAALRLVGLADRMDHRPAQLSGGQQQRVAIARALVTDPTVIVADEPTGDLDRASAAEVLGLMAGLVRDQGKTVVMVTHDPKSAEAADRVRRLEKGVMDDLP
jgi:putative ABC transport system ATP-binding protein